MLAQTAAQRWMVTGMAKCKDCLHYEACSNFSKIINSAVDVETGCEHFKNRIDVTEVVRCKDCYHNEQCICVCCEDGEMIKCGLHHKHMDANGYCHKGRRC